MKKRVKSGFSVGGDVVQMPIRLTPQLVDKLFGDKSDRDGLPRFQYPRDEHTRAAVWSELLPVIREWLEAGGVVTYFSVETRFEFRMG